jgi:hypothetical protein
MYAIYRKKRKPIATKTPASALSGFGYSKPILIPSGPVA